MARRRIKRIFWRCQEYMFRQGIDKRIFWRSTELSGSGILYIRLASSLLIKVLFVIRVKIVMIFISILLHSYLEISTSLYSSHKVRNCIYMYTKMKLHYLYISRPYERLIIDGPLVVKRAKLFVICLVRKNLIIATSACWLKKHI